MILPFIAAWAADQVFNDGGVTNAITGKTGSLADDYMNIGKNRYKGGTYTPGELQYGGQYGADNIAEAGFNAAAKAQERGNWAQGQAQADRGPQAFENQELSNNEAMSRGYDQSGAIQLAREAAMGMAPSEAAYMMQSGLNSGLANQQAQMGSARGAGGLAMAGANAAANSAAMQQSAYNQAGQLRANEMAAARAQYGGLAGQQREQDQARLGMGNQMSQFNANANDQYRLGMGGLSNQYAQTGLGYYNAAQNPYNQQGNMDVEREKIAGGSYDQNQARQAAVAQANADAKKAQIDRLYSAGGTMAQTAAGGLGKK